METIHYDKVHATVDLAPCVFLSGKDLLDETLLRASLEKKGTRLLIDLGHDSTPPAATKDVLALLKRARDARTPVTFTSVWRDEPTNGEMGLMGWFVSLLSDGKQQLRLALEILDLAR